MSARTLGRVAGLTLIFTVAIGGPTAAEASLKRTEIPAAATPANDVKVQSLEIVWN